MELFNYYSLCECANLNPIKKKLNILQDDGKIEYETDKDILKIVDIYLDEYEIEDLNKLFDKYDVFAYPDYENDLDDSYRNYNDEENEEF
jgi:hypothetical protein